MRPYFVYFLEWLAPYTNNEATFGVAGYALYCTDPDPILIHFVDGQLYTGKREIQPGWHE